MYVHGVEVVDSRCEAWGREKLVRYGKIGMFCICIVCLLVDCSACK